jgi:hypothetical protein
MADLIYPVIDPRNESELVELAIAAVYEYSDKQLNDFSTGSALRVLIEGLCFAGAEILYYANQIIEALVVAYLSNYGITRSLGTAAQAELTFTLTAALASSVQLAAGTTVQTQGGIVFTTDAQLVFPPGAVVGKVSATAATIGKTTNAAANTINQLIQPLSYIQSVTNLAAATGGSDEETQQQAIDRGLGQVRRRNLVSAADYEDYVVEILGVGSVAHAIGNRSGDKISEQLGSVHVFCLDANGQPPNTADLASMVQALKVRTMLGTEVWASSVNLVDVNVRLVARLAIGESAEAVADILWAELQDYLAHDKFAMGQTILLNEVKFALRQTAAIGHIQSLWLNDWAKDFVMPNDYSQPKAKAIFMKLLDDRDNVFDLFRGDAPYEGDFN